MGWLAVFLGLIVLLACFLLPREIGREDEPLVEVKLPRPDLEQLALRMHLRNKVRPSAANARRATPAGSASPEPPSAMGAPQPILSDFGQ